MSASSFTRTACTLPSASAANSMSWTWPRPWMVEVAASVRPSVQRTGAPRSMANALQRISSA